MTQLPKRLLGRSGLLVSRIALGTVELGQDYGISGSGDNRKPDEAAAARLLQHALDLGVTFIDTARGYGDAEAIIGRAISHRRDEFVIASKVATPADLRGAAVRAHVLAEVDTSLAALQTDHVDLMYSHTSTVDEIARDEVFSALAEARQAGKIRAIGASTYGADAPLAAIRHGGYDCLQVAYNLLDGTLEAEVLPAALAANLGVTVRSVLLKGALTHRNVHLPEGLAALKAAVANAQAIARAAGIAELPEAAYRYVLANPAVSVALVGTSHARELTTAVGYALEPALPADLIERLKNNRVTDPDLLNPGKWPAI